MSRFMKLDHQGIVIDGTIATQDFIDTGVFGNKDDWIEAPDFVCAGRGFFYDKDKNAFIPPQPFPSWVLNDEYCWEPPIAPPERINADDPLYDWVEETTSWNEQ